MIPACQRCKSTRIATAQAHCSDMFFGRIGGKEKNGYVPEDMGIGGGDDLNIDYCLDCGQIQGPFPLSPCELEKADE